MMGGWIDEVQIGYVGGKHDMNQLCFSFMWISADDVHEAASDDIITGRNTFTATISVASHALHAAILCICISEIERGAS